ncbi:hypothetical protein [Marinobacterium arenosum]|uniref:hypothetical protein n=1 Tax=Marinobacterium arenosum TaxID=2862496 RepID=UPI001C977105|nr:hypothetical protein [Marinobacterium arenosum]MBY4676808.1 hypothetical protein [Marinobacterium arenosum]
MTVLLEDLQAEILLQIDKLQALSQVWMNVEFTDYTPAPATRAHYAMTVDDQLETLKKMMEQLNQLLAAQQQAGLETVAH